MGRVLVVTNDFPPRPGGIQNYVFELTRRLGDVVVYTSSWRGAEEFDAALDFPVVRDRASVLLPTPRVVRRAVGLLRSYGCDAVWFGAAAPLALMAPSLRRAGATRIVASTHGHETGWALLPVARQLLRRIGRGVDVVTCISKFTKSRLEPLLGHVTHLEVLYPGVDTSVFYPGCGGAAVRSVLGITADRPVIVCVSRLMPRKGQDTLIRALPLVHESVPDALLLLVGGGPYRRRLERLARHLGVSGSVIFTGSLPADDLPAHYDAGDVFAMPCRTRLRGLDVEGFGMVFLEAQACGLPVVAGHSGGAAEAAGAALTARSVTEATDAVVRLLREDGRARRASVPRSWDVAARELVSWVVPAASRSRER